MSKKILSILIATMLLVTVFAALPAFAAGGVAFESDFEEGTLDGWSAGADMKMTVVPDVVDYDGAASTAVKMEIKDEKSGVAITGSSPGSLRGNFAGITWVTSGETVGIDPAVTIEKIDVYVDRANWLKGGGYCSFGNIRFSPSVTDGVVNSVSVYSRGEGNGSVSIGTLRDGWNRVVVVRNYPTPGSEAGATMTAWLNDELKVTGASSPRFPTPGKAAIQFNAGTYNTGEYFMFDNVEILYDPDPATIVSSIPAKDAVGVDVDTNEITLNFSDSILTNASGGAIAPANFTVSGGVEVEDIEISADRKSVTLTLDRRLAFETTYTVSVSNVKDLAGNIVTGSTSFTTEDTPEFEYEFPVFKNEALFEGGTGEVLERLENGYISCQYSITNYKPQTQQALMFVVFQENGKIKGFIFKPYVIPANGGEAMVYGGFKVDDAANSKIQAYAWDSMTAGKSLMSMVTIDANGISSTGSIE